MRELITKKLQNLSNEIESLTNEKKSISKRLGEIEIRTHQLVGAIYELQLLLNEVDKVTDPSPSSEEPQG